ncbi:hypothetical protein C4571_02180 [Candidatus Parcubacteria bacterium]|nr:MAG: hypothetical protein C4571_02180 [Candidatus Parcubacteria bacterium]
MNQVKAEAKSATAAMGQLFNSGIGLIKRGFTSLLSLARRVFSELVQAAKWAALGIAAISVALIKIGSDVTEAENLFVVSMGEMRSQAEAWAKEFSRTLRLNVNDVKKFLGTFNVMLSSLGLAADEAYEMSKGLVRLAYDISSFYNLKPEEAFLKLQAGITGEVEPLKRLGIVLNETTVKAYAMAHGIGEAGKELTENQKILARYGALMEATKKAQGDLNRTLGSSTNIFRSIWAAIREVAQHIGKGIVESKAFQAAVKWLGDTFIELKDKILGVNISETIDRWTDSIRRFFTETLNVGARLQNMKQQALDLLRSIPIGGTITETKVHSTGFGTEKTTTTRARTLADIGGIREALKALGVDAKQFIADAFTWIEQKILAAFAYIKSGEAKRDFEGLKRSWAAFREDVAVIAGVLRPTYTILKNLAGLAFDFAKAHPDIAALGAAFILLGPPIARIVGPLATIASFLFTIGSGVIPVIISGIGAVVGVLGGPLTLAIIGVVAAITSIYLNWENIWKMFRDGWWAIRDAAIETWEMIKEAFTFDALTLALNGFIDGAKATWQDFSTWFKSLWNETISAGIDKVKEFFGVARPQHKESPSMIENWAAGIGQIEATFASAMSNMMAQSQVLTAQSRPNYQTSYSTVINGGINVSLPPSNDPETLSDEFVRRLQHKMNRRSRVGWDPIS